MVADLCNRFLTHKKHLLSNGEIVSRTFADYRSICETIVGAFGRDRPLTDLDATDFQTLRASMAARLGPVAIAARVQRVKTVCKFAFAEGIIDRPIRFGASFAAPPRHIIRKARAANGMKMFERAEIHKLLKAASTQMRAMILLGANCGFGNSDCGQLPLSAMDLPGGWIDYPRPKTGITRRCPLWFETVEALRVAIADRPEPSDKAHGGLVFLSTAGRPLHRLTPESPITKAFTRLCRELGLYRKGRSFYALRHNFETIAGASLDQISVNAIMGHCDPSMAGQYRERIDDDRLRAVSDHVRQWLFGTEGNK